MAQIYSSVKGGLLPRAKSEKILVLFILNDLSKTRMHNFRMSSSRSWREKLYTSNKLDNYLKRPGCPKALKESLGRQRKVQKNLK